MYSYYLDGQVDTDFYFGLLNNGNLSILLANSNPHWVAYSVEAPGIGFKDAGNVAPNDTKNVTILVLHEVFSPRFQTDKGIHLKLNNSNVTVLGHNLVHGHNTDTFVIMPYSRLCVAQYVYYGISVSSGSTVNYNGFISIVSTENTTTVTLIIKKSAKITIDDRSSGDYVPGKYGPYVIHKALQTVYIESRYDLSGTKIIANKPVSVFSGHDCARIPSYAVECGHLIEHLLPTALWDKEYYTVPLAKRPYTIKMLAAHDSTTITVHCNNVTNSYRLNEGESESKDLRLSEHCAIFSDKEILVAQFSHGHHFDNLHNGGPMMTLVPGFEKQYFNTLHVSTIHSSDYTNHINLIVIAHCFQPSHMYLVKGDGTSEALTQQVWIPIQVNGTARMYTTQMNIPEGMVKIVHHMQMALMSAIVYGFVGDKGYGHTGWNRKFFTG